MNPNRNGILHILRRGLSPLTATIDRMMKFCAWRTCRAALPAPLRRLQNQMRA
jgi:hypothetical protein